LSTIGAQEKALPMARLWICAAGAAAAWPISLPALAGPPVASRASVPVNPRANELFDSDPLLQAWALRTFDDNHDGWLTLFEAQPAIAAFKDIADGDRDGRVTPYEYDRAKQFIAARQ
jgi:hypothetical protein